MSLFSASYLWEDNWTSGHMRGTGIFHVIVDINLVLKLWNTTDVCIHFWSWSIQRQAQGAPTPALCPKPPVPVAHTLQLTLLGGRLLPRRLGGQEHLREPPASLTPAGVTWRAWCCSSSQWKSQTCSPLTSCPNHLQVSGVFGKVYKMDKNNQWTPKKNQPGLPAVSFCLV